MTARWYARIVAVVGVTVIITMLGACTKRVYLQELRPSYEESAFECRANANREGVPAVWYEDECWKPANRLVEVSQ